jgi:hypothetical protein
VTEFTILKTLAERFMYDLAWIAIFKKIPIPTVLTLRAAGRHIKLDFLKIPNLTANWPIGDLVSRC